MNRHYSEILALVEIIKARARAEPNCQIGHGTYIGDDPVLKGKNALIRPSLQTGSVLAQFDDQDLYLDDRALGFGWHTLPAREFQLDEKEEA